MNTCNLCGTDGVEVLQLQAGFEILAHGQGVPFDIRTVLCTSCGLVRTDPQPDEDLLRAFYSAQERDVFVEEQGDALRLPGESVRRDQAAWLAEALGSLDGSRVLEIGCYEGFLLHLLAEQGARVTGVEPSAGAAALAVDRWGIDVRVGLFEDQDWGEERFDLIVLSHVLEHVRDPRAVLEGCRSLLREGGSLFVEVPNVLRPRFESAVNFFTFDHLFNFSPAALCALGLRCGFETLAVDDDYPFPAFRYLGRAASPEVPAELGLVENVAECRRVVADFVERRRDFVERLAEKLAPGLAAWLEEDAALVIYGAGYHTEYLLEATELRRQRIVGLIDGNPAKQGTRCLGYPVHGPEDLVALRPDVVVISSYDFQDEMVAEVKRHLPEVPRIVTFYDGVDAFSSWQR